MTTARLAAAVLTACLLVPAADAQVTPLDRQQAVLATLRADVRARVLLEGDSLLMLRTVRRGAGRLDRQTGLVRADYRVEARLPAPPADAEAAARAYLRAHADRYGLDPSLADLQVARVVSGAYSHHVTFTQTVEGVPVYGRDVQVNLDRDRQPLMVLSAYEPALRGARLEAPRLSAADATAVARGFLRGAAAVVSVPELVVVPAPRVRRAWRVEVLDAQEGIEWAFLVDARTGEALLAIERSTHGLHGTGRRGDRSGAVAADAPAAFPFSSPSSGSSPVTRHPSSTSTDGIGLVFDPDPLTTAGVPYGGPYADNNDADTPELNAQRRQVTLRDLTRSGGRYTLSGPYVRIVGEPPPGGVSYTPPEEARADGFQYTRAHPGFEAVMAYYHTDASQRRVQALDVGRPILQQPQRINPRGFSADDARFYPTTGLIALGTGGIDDAEDADVILHEYAHALLHASQPALYQAVDGTALHEGWADYWAGSYSRGLIERGQGWGDWRRLFPWDGNVGCWQGRRLDHPGFYDPANPQRMSYPPTPGCSPMGTIYQRGLLWATTLMEIYGALGQDVTDRLNLASHAFLGAVTSAPAFEVAAEALLAADQALYGGANRGVLLQVLGARGYVDAGAFGPTVEHEPLTSTEQAGGTRRVEVTARGAQAAIEAVTLHYRVDGGAEQTLALDAQGGDIFSADLPMPTAPATLTYHLEARDAQGRVTRLPAAPGASFSFTAGPDLIAPALAHTAREQVPLAAWPPEITATATDNLGVDTVTVSYEVLDVRSTVTASGAFGLAREGNVFYATWPVEAALLGVGSRVRYRVEARDVAQQPNIATLPASGFFEIEIVSKGVLAFFDFEAEAAGLTAEGVWARGTPQHGLQAAHTGAGVWMTGLDEPYPGERSTSHLYLPAFDLRGDAPYLVFWHWYDAEQGAPCETLCDGAAVELSTDGGATWTVTPPLGGYPGTVGEATRTPLAGSGAWGGYSYGWQRAIVPLPALPDVRVRFTFATDAGNVFPTRYGYAGWAVDDVQITTLLPEDTLPPLAEALPPPVRVQPAGAPPPPVVVEARDDTGIVRAEVRYEFVQPGATLRDTLRLEQMPTGRTRFSGAFTSLPAPAAGDLLAFTIYLEDADGNGVAHPESGTFEIKFRTLAQTNLLADARAAGRWELLDGKWSVGATAAGEAPRAALVLVPQDLPANAEAIHFRLQHRFRFEAGAGGNVKVSADGGATWQVLTPEAGYPDVLDAPGHPMHGEGVFAGPRDTLDATFDLAPFAGRQVRLRLDLAAARPLALGEFWTIDSATQYASSIEDAFETPRVFALHPAQPTPFREATTLTFTLDEAAAVRLEVYDVLGRRVATLVDGEPHPPGTYTRRFDGSALGSGVYFVRLQAGPQQQTRQVVLAR